MFCGVVEPISDADDGSARIVSMDFIVLTTCTRLGGNQIHRLHDSEDVKFGHARTVKVCF